MYFKFSHGLNDSYINFNFNIDFIFLKAKYILKEYKTIEREPIVTLSPQLPNLQQGWQKIDIYFLTFMTIFIKQYNNILYFYFYVPNIFISSIEKIYLRVMIINTIAISNMLRDNILFIHGGLLSNGTIFFGPCYSGKTTLFQRINKTNKFLKALCSDNCIFNLNENIVYSLPYKWINLNNSEEQSNDYVKFKEIYYLKQDKMEQIIEGNYKDYRKELIDNIKCVLCYEPFNTRGLKPELAWFQCLDNDLQVEFYKRIEYLVDKFIIKYKIKPQIITTNTDNINKKYQVFEDKMEEKI